MDFTREPIIETVITPKEGCKLVVRSSKGNGQEEHFVDALEVVSFGYSFFFRSLERPKAFLVPATDYEILEVREARMVLKNVGIDRAIKIGGGREGQMRTPREQQPYIEKAEPVSHDSSSDEEEDTAVQPAAEKAPEERVDKKRDRRRNYRRRRGRDGTTEEETAEGETAGSKNELQESVKGADGENSPMAQQVLTTSILTSLLPPPPTLISETIARYKDNALFKDAFYTKEERTAPPAVVEAATDTSEDAPAIPQPEYGTFELSEEEEEQIYQKRKQQSNTQDESAHDAPDDLGHENGEHHENDEHKEPASHE
ncbi:MAG TPA: hypothetical protein VGP47_05075 [Parachlamydiaceae bacterium]|nr:hypothetical protein [Parachlamydiaceae bacterium]